MQKSRYLVLILLAVSLLAGLSPATAAPNAQTALQFNGTSQYVTFGAAPSLGLAQFTLETWFKKTGNGTPTTTGTSGIPDLIPLISKGAADVDNHDNRDIDYILGIRASDGVLAADFEEGAAGTSPSLNHPVAGTTHLSDNVWYHAAATYDGVTWKLYLNGNLEATLAVGQPTRSDSICHAGLGTTLTSTGVAKGFFQGVLDEARIWNTARTQAQIQTNRDLELTSGTGLVARWGLNDAAGTTAANSISGGVNGALTNGPTWVTDSPFTPAVPAEALRLGGSQAYVTFGAAPSLGLAQFTLETWFKKEGAGTPTTTGTNGVPDMLPLISKGAADVDQQDTRDINYILGIRASDGVLAADFEEGAAGTSPSLNHPVAGTTHLSDNVWYHAAATYDGVTWKLYLNGNLEATLAVGQPTRSDSICHAGLGTTLTSTGVAKGFFQGVLDEARIWNTARTQAQIQAALNTQIIATQSGLVARYGLAEGVGTVVHSSAGTTIDGTITGTGWSWTTGAPFSVNQAPNQPALISPANAATGVALTAPLRVTVSDPEANPMTVTLYGRKVNAAPGSNFSIVLLPDTQNYMSGSGGGGPATFTAQTQWIVNNKTARTIVYVAHLGDIVETGNNTTQWQNANSAMSLLEPANIPFGLDIGNHDEWPYSDPTGTAYFNQTFGTSRFAGRSYYGGHYGSNNDAHYDLFQSGSLSFIVVYLPYNPTPSSAILSWADGVLKANSTRRAIVVNHDTLGTGNPGSFTSQGQAVFDALKNNPNLFLIVAGHAPGVGRRSDTVNGNTIYTVMSDYQNLANGGNGYLRVMEFSPATNQILVKTYSPTLNAYDTTADNQFTLAYPMQGSNFQVIGTNTNVASGSMTSFDWPGRSALSQYEWYVTMNDGSSTTTGPTWSYSTAGPTAVGLTTFQANAGRDALLPLGLALGALIMTGCALAWRKRVG